MSVRMTEAHGGLSTPSWEELGKVPQLSAELFGPEFSTDPHSILAELRRTSPVRQVVLPTGETVWLVTRYDDARRALTDTRLSKRRVEAFTVRDGLISPELREAINADMLSSDPPDHSRLRRLVSTAFTARRVESLRPRVQEITDELLDAMAGRDRLDLIDEFAFPLPIRVICELLGVPSDDRDSFRAWSNTIVAGVASGPRLAPALRSIVDYIRQLIADKRSHPADDLISALIAINEDGDRLTDNELSSMIFLLLIAGHETTVNLIGNGAFLLLSQPDRRERLRCEPALLPTAIEEFLRYESPVQTSTFRITTDAIELGDQHIPAGQPVLISLLSANRDDERFTEPMRFDLGRRDSPHLAFGHGIHYCLGAPLARLEALVAFGSLLTRYPEIRLAVPPAELTWRSGVLLRSLVSLPVALGASASRGRDYSAGP
jgi:cytochrome P450